MIVAGYHQDGPRQVNMQLWNWRGFDVVNAHERDPTVSVRGMREAADAIEKGLIDPRLLITHRFPLNQLGEALDTARDRPGNFDKAVVLTG
jgi:threonine dehydrogenase-like Zn-dependent dehydrogenase